MSQTNRFWKLVILSILITFVVTGTISFFLWQAFSPLQKQVILSIFSEYSGYLACIFLVCLTVFYAGLEIIYAAHIKPVKKISSEANVIYASNPSHRIRVSGGRDIRKLITIINNFADMFENLNQNITEQILSAREELEKERNLLAAVMAELPQGVLICNLDGRILLYNTHARRLLTPEKVPGTSEQFLGLGRSVYHLLSKQSIETAVQNVRHELSSGSQAPVAWFTTTTLSEKTINVETTSVLDSSGNMTGFILAINAVDKEIKRFRTAQGKMAAFMKALRKKDLDEDLMSQSRNLCSFLAQALLPDIPLVETDLVPLLGTIKDSVLKDDGFHLNILIQNNTFKIPVDSFLFSRAILLLLKTLHQLNGENEFFITAAQKDTHNALEILWKKTPIPGKMILQKLEESHENPANFHYLLFQNRAELKTGTPPDQPCTSVMITWEHSSIDPRPVHRSLPIVAGSRPEFYDFDLFQTESIQPDLLENELKTLTYTVFDTETTGLNPDRGDEIISIAAVRIVNGRLIYQDIFESLVDPKRDVPMASYNIHGISYDMLKGQPDIQTVLPVFKNYASDSIFVGHNIAFDMKMLKVKEKITQIRFSNPVLDTLLLSAVLHPVHERHDLENIAQRLGVEIMGRHTALGDAIATANIFLKLIPMLNSSGIYTLKDALAASRKSYYARVRY